MKPNEKTAWWHPAEDAVAVEVVERRAAPRSPATGSITLCYFDPAAVVAPATLVDVSEAGFRAAHDRPDLSPGTTVRFRMGEVSGEARVAWTRQQDGGVQSGFSVLSSGRKR